MIFCFASYSGWSFSSLLHSRAVGVSWSHPLRFYFSRMYHIDGLGLLVCLFLNDGVAREVFGHWLSLCFEDSLLPEDWVVTSWMDGILMMLHGMT
jgi:hypothetical protein